MTDDNLYVPSDDGRVMTSRTEIVYRVQRYGVTREFDVDSRDRQIATLQEALEALAGTIEAAGAHPVGPFKFRAVLYGTVRTLPKAVVDATGIGSLGDDIENVSVTRAPDPGWPAVDAETAGIEDTPCCDRGGVDGVGHLDGAHTRPGAT